MLLKTWLQTNFPEVFIQWERLVIKEQREYKRKWAKEHYLPANRKSREGLSD